VTRPTELVVFIGELLERLGIPYQVGGSVASSFHGIYRTSEDIDVVIDPNREQLEALARELESEFYVSRAAIDEAFSHRSTFNAIHEQTLFKVDFFLKGPTPFDAEELRRSIRNEVGDSPGHSVLLKSQEDTILRKLDWFRRGGGVSDRQWNDVVSVLAASRDSLDEAYLDRWAAELHVEDLLTRARGEAADL